MVSWSSPWEYVVFGLTAGLVCGFVVHYLAFAVGGIVHLTREWLRD